MTKGRLVYLTFVATAAAQLAALALVGETRFNKAGIMVMVILAGWLGRRSRVAWWLFVVGNTWLLLASGPLILMGGHVLLGNVIALTVGSAGQLVILFSRPMRAWITPPADDPRHVVTA